MIVKDQKTGRKKDVRLPKSFKKRWIEALRSEKFKQGTGELHNTNKDTLTQNMSSLDEDKRSKEESKANVQTDNDSKDNDL